MPLRRLAASILLALSLAALSALAAGPRPVAPVLSGQGLGLHAGALPATRAGDRLARAEQAQRRLHRIMLPAPILPTIPPAGESIPGAGQ